MPVEKYGLESTDYLYIIKKLKGINPSSKPNFNIIHMNLKIKFNNII